jgi:hypothetical protein
LRRDDTPAPTTSGAQVLSAGLVFEGLEEMIGRFAALGWPLCYQLNALRWTPDRALLQRATRHVAAASAEPQSGAFAGAQRNRLLAAAHATLHAEEFIGVERAEAADLAASILGKEGLSLRSGSDDDRMSIESGLHSLLLFGELDPGDDPLAGARTSEDWARIVGWRPPASARAPLAASDGDDADTEDEARAAPGLAITLSSLDARELLANGSSPFVFVSYSHADSPSIEAVLRALHAHSVPLWFDAGIPGAVDYDDVLEDRLKACRGVIALLSNRSVASKYCRRELKFADALGKPILPVLLEPVELAGGLGLMLGAIQALRPDDPGPIAAVTASWLANRSDQA